MTKVFIMDTNEIRNTNLKYYIDILYQRRPVIAIVFIVTMVITIIAYIMTPPEYTAQTQLLIESQYYTKQNPANISLNNTSFYFETIPELMRSEPVIHLAVKRLGLREGTKNFNNMSIRLIRDLHMKHLSDSSMIFTVYIKSENPVFAAKAVNAITNSYIEFSDEQRKKRISAITIWLQGELTSLKNKVEKSEIKLIKYASKQESDNNGYPIKFPTGPYYNIGAKEITGIESKYTMLQIKLTNLLQKYKDKYPLVIQLRNDLKALSVRLNMMKQAMLEASKGRIKYMMLSNNVELNKDLYNMLTKELKEVNIFGEIGATTVTVIDHAGIPTKRSDHGFIFWLLIGLIASATTGIISGMIADQLNNSIKGETDIERFVKYPVIGILPFLEEIKTNDPNKVMGIFSSRSFRLYVESLRQMRINLKYSFVAKSGRVLLVTSTAKNEGKTTVSAGLAYILSITGSNVLLLDADVKRPTIHKLFNSEQVPGYTELLIDDKLSITDVIKQSSYNSLYYLTSGRQPPNFAELLDSPGSKELIDKLRSNFDYVIIDSPPAGITVDAAILSQQVDGIIFVVKANGYPREQIKRIITFLASINAKIIGIVLNHLDKDKRHYKDYYYSKEHYYEK